MTERAGFEAIATRMRTTGCTPEQVRELERAQGVTFPASLRSYLLTMGVDAGGLLCGTDMGYAQMLEMRQGLEGSLVDTPCSWSRPDQAAVFAMHQGYVFWFVDAAEGDDPPVHEWSEGHDEDTVVGTNLLDWIERLDLSAVAEDPDRRNLLGVAATRRLALTDERCPRCGGDLEWLARQFLSAEGAPAGRFAVLARCRAERVVFWRWGDEPDAPLSESEPPSRSRHSGQP